MVRVRRGGGRGRSGPAAAAAVLAVAALMAGCAGEGGPGAEPVVSPSVTSTGPRVAAGTFPTVPGYTWQQVPDDEWAQAWAAVSSSYGGFLADGQAKYVRDTGDHPVGMVVVAWPAPGKAGPAAMQAALDQQGRQAGEHDGTAGVKEVAGHDVLEFTDGRRQPNWYWVSGDELVMVTGDEYDAGAAFVAALSAATR